MGQKRRNLDTAVGKRELKRDALPPDEGGDDSGAAASSDTDVSLPDVNSARQMAARRRLEQLREQKQLRELIGRDVWDDEFG